MPQDAISLVYPYGQESLRCKVHTVRAVEQIRRMRGGSQSHLMRCSDDRYYVVKFQNNPQHRRILVNEFLGTRLASLLGLPTTESAIVEVNERLIQLTSDLHIEIPLTKCQSRIPCQAGLQFGSCFPGDPHYQTLFDLLPDSRVLEASNLEDFLGMLVFDIWTCNTDGRQVIFGRRDVGTPYYAWMIDQGFCFNGDKWNFPDTPRRSLYDRHVVYQHVEGIDSFEPWLTRLESEIGEEVLLDIAKTIPPEWYEGDSVALDCLLVHLSSRRKRVRELLTKVRNASPNAFPKWIERIAIPSMERSCSSVLEQPCVSNRDPEVPESFV